MLQFLLYLLLALLILVHPVFVRREVSFTVVILYNECDPRANAGAGSSCGLNVPC